MIRKVKFNNFYSFQDEQEISFLAKKKEGYDYFNSKSENQITKIASFIGSNASGKTNIMRLFSFLSYFVCISSKNEAVIKPEVPYKTFFNNEKESSFYIEFENNQQIYYYSFSIKNNAVKKESLRVKKMVKYSKEIEVFSRNLNNVKSLNSKFFETFPVKFLKNIRPDVSLIAFLKANYNIKIINDIHSYFAGFKTNINEKGEINNIAHKFKAIDLYLKDAELKKEMEDFICNFDLGLDAFEIKKEIEDNKIGLNVKGIHNTKENNNKLDFNYESRGTQSLFFALAGILSALRDNNIIIIDELESGFHPEALNKLISYFINRNEKGSAQIIFSSHSLGFINKLDMHQIYLTEKDKEGKSSTYRLNEVENIRSDENFLSKYMTGVYGAFPKIRI